VFLVDDMVCDFAAIYHRDIDPESGDFAGMTGPQFARYASRLPLYEGAVRARLARLRDDDETPAAAPEAAPVVATFDATPLALTTNPLLMHFIEYG
jgi:hypothetical protein